MLNYKHLTYIFISWHKKVQNEMKCVDQNERKQAQALRRLRTAYVSDTIATTHCPLRSGSIHGYEYANANANCKTSHFFALSKYKLRAFWALYLNSISLMCGTIYEFKLVCLSSSQLTERWKSTKFCHESLRNNLRWRSEQFLANWLSAVFFRFNGYRGV